MSGRIADRTLPAAAHDDAAKGFLGEIWREFVAILRGKSANASCVLDVLIAQFGERVRQDSDSFSELRGDSMAAVTFAIELESLLGALPDDWAMQAIAQLERLRETRID